MLNWMRILFYYRFNLIGCNFISKFMVDDLANFFVSKIMIDGKEMENFIYYILRNFPFFDLSLRVIVRGGKGPALHQHLEQGFVDRANLFEAQTPPADGLLISAEAGSAWTLIYPDFQVVLPFKRVAGWPLGYATAAGDREFLRFLDLWVDLMQSEGLISRLRDHWILGRTAVAKKPRWSVIRDVLHWVE